MKALKNAEGFTVLGENDLFTVNGGRGKKDTGGCCCGSNCNCGDNYYITNNYGDGNTTNINGNNSSMNTGDNGNSQNGNKNEKNDQSKDGINSQGSSGSGFFSSIVSFFKGLFGK
jgi:hypothetical protein